MDDRNYFNESERKTEEFYKSAMSEEGLRNWFGPWEDTMKENKFEKIGREIGKLVGEKNLAYGDSFSRSGECLRQMYPDGISPEKMDDALIIVRILDKLFRIANQKDAFGESPFKDICGYSLLGINKSNEE